MPSCDSCQTRPGSWTATFADGVAFDVCDDCVTNCDDRVLLTRWCPKSPHVPSAIPLTN